MKTLLHPLAVALGGSLGALARYYIAMISARLFGTAFPIGTFIINITGSLFLGWFYTIVTDRMVVSDATRLGIAVGFVGAYTTFSTYMFESDALLRDGAIWKATANLVGSVVLGLLAVRFGVWLAAR